MKRSRVIISALHGGSGKTILSLGIIAALRQQDRPIVPFKKGPDYIDAGWLALSAGAPCYNLDTYLLSKDQICQSFINHSSDNHLAFIEGNRGLFDSIDIEGTTSTAELAILLDSPVILILDCTKTTRTVAALLLGCLHFDPRVKISGVILNQIAGRRHESIVRRSIENHCNVPVIGAVPKLSQNIFPERHMGLIPTQEHEWANAAIDKASEIVKKYVDLKALTDIIEKNSEFHFKEDTNKIELNDAVSENKILKNKVRIGIARDSAFQFYYQENIDSLIESGADIVYISPVNDCSLPDNLDALYIGGGFPESHAQQLADNKSFKNQVRKFADDGFPIYAECGGLMYLGESLKLQDKSYEMVGVFPIVFGLSAKPQAHGYTRLSVKRPNPYFPDGIELKGHEFHYSKVLDYKGPLDCFAFDMIRGEGFIKGSDGICYKNVLATYTHLHATGTDTWAKGLIKCCINKIN